MRMLFLEGEKSYLRSLREDDLALVSRWVHRLRTQPSLLSGPFPFHVLSEDTLLQIKSQMPELLLFAICLQENDQPVGLASLHEFHWINRCVRYSLLSGEQVPGIGSEVTQILLRYAFDTLNLHRMELSVFAEHTRVLKGYQQLGFQEEGRLRQKYFHEGEFSDEILMAILRSEWVTIQLDS